MQIITDLRSAQTSFGDEALYSTTVEKAARLMYALVDGNKGIGVFMMLMTLKRNGLMIRYTQPELIELG